VLVDCWLSAVEPPAPDEPPEVAVDGAVGEPLSPAVVPAPVPVWLSWALWLGSDEPVCAGEPVGPEEPVGVDEPVWAGEPVGSEEPVGVDEPV
jgi:hypothetical protein